MTRQRSTDIFCATSSWGFALFLGVVLIVWADFLVAPIQVCLKDHSFQIHYNSIQFLCIYILQDKASSPKLKEEKKKTVVDVTSFYFSICIKGKG
jgi:hypothetical protein